MLKKMMIQEIKVDNLLDCRGLFCPVPVLITREEIEKLEPGQILQIIADDPAAEEDIPRWAKRTGNTILHKWKEGNDLYFIVRKGRA